MCIKSKDNMPIGVFDSGVGGLTVVRSLRSVLPSEDIIYFGDTARVPYGNKSASTIKRFSRNIMDFLLRNGVKIIVAACNTASSLAVPYLAKKYPVPVIGVIGPGVAEAVRTSNNGKIGVIGTNSTIASKAYDRELSLYKGRWRLYSASCPLFVPLVENRFIKDPVARMVAERYLSGIKKKNIDTLILGCTHYPILRDIISEVMGEVNIVDSASSVAMKVKEELEKRQILSGRKKGRIRCYVSDDPESFKDVADIFLKEKITVKKIIDY